MVDFNLGFVACFFIFCLQISDILRPEPARVRIFLSGVVNFARFREARLAAFDRVARQSVRFKYLYIYIYIILKFLQSIYAYCELLFVGLIGVSSYRLCICNVQLVSQISMHITIISLRHHFILRRKSIHNFMKR
jgi:hypothetical protein